MKIIAWWKIAQPAWLFLLFGYVGIFISLMLCFEVPSSGAVLLCCCLLAEISFNRQPWRKMANAFSMENAKTKKDENGNFIIGTTTVKGGDRGHPLDKLLAVAKPSHLNNDKSEWIISQVNLYVEKYVYWAITISAIIGSLLWAYGHLLFKSECWANFC